MLFLGVMAGGSFPAAGDPALAAAAVAIGLALVLHAVRWRGGALVAATFLCGLGMGSVQMSRCPADDVSQYASEDGVLVRATVRGLRDVVPVGVFSEGRVGVAEAVSLEGESSGPGPAKSTRVVPVSGGVRVRVDRASGRLEGSGTLEVLGTLSVVRRARNPGERDGSWHDRAAGVGAELRVESMAQVREVSPDRSRLDRAVDAWRSTVRRALRRGFNDTRDFALLRSLLLGDADVRLGDIREDFQRTGTSHHLAVSGTHLAFLGGAMYSALRAGMAWRRGGWLTPRRCVLLTFGAMLAYGVAVAPSAAMVRSVLLAGMVAIGLAARRRVVSANLLGACAVLMIAVDPGAAFGAGFQLTFFVLLVILVVGPALKRALDTYRDPDYAVADAWCPHTASAARRRRKWRLLATAATAAVAFAGAAPLVGHHFSQVNPYTALASLALEPFVFAALLAGAAKVVLTAACPWGATLFAIPAAWAAAALRWAVHAMALAPGTGIPTASLPAWLAVTCAAALFVPMAVRKCLPARSAQTATWIAVLAAIFASPFAAELALPRPDGVRLTVMEMRNAHPILLELPGTRPWLINPPSDETAFRTVLQPLLRERGIRRLGAVLITQPTPATDTALRLLQSSFPYDAVHGTDAAPLTSGNTWRLGNREAVVIDVLWPEPDMGWTGRDAGAGLRILFSGRTVLIGGSLDPTGIHELLRSPSDLRCDVLLLAERSRRFPDTASLVSTASPTREIWLSSPAGRRSPTAQETTTPATTSLETRTSGSVELTLDTRGKITLIPFLSR